MIMIVMTWRISPKHIASHREHMYRLDSQVIYGYTRCNAHDLFEVLEGGNSPKEFVLPDRRLLMFGLQH